MRMKQAIAVSALVLISSAAMAGFVSDVAVTVTLNADGSGTSSGAMPTARFSKDKVQYIGCGIRRIGDGVGGVVSFGFCQSSNANGDLGFCTSENPALLASIGDQDDFSFITFTWDAAGECTMIGNSTQSFYIPKLVQ